MCVAACARAFEGNLELHLEERKSDSFKLQEHNRANGGELGSIGKFRRDRFDSNFDALLLDPSLQEVGPQGKR
jgi:hypothetical protein